MRKKRQSPRDRLRTFSMIAGASCAIPLFISFFGMAGSLTFGRVWDPGWIILFFGMIPCAVASFLLSGAERSGVILPCAIVSIVFGVGLPVVSVVLLSNLILLLILPTNILLVVQGVFWLLHVLGGGKSEE